jgi:putative serine protease PepD
VLTAVDGEELTSAEELLAALRDVEPGDRLPLTVVRDGEQDELDVTVEARPE